MIYQTLFEEMGIDALLIFDLKGTLLKSIELEHDKNIAAMSGIVMTMCKELAKDLKLGEANQLIVKGKYGLFIAFEDKEKQLIGLVTRDSSKLGLLMRKIEILNT